MNRREFVASLLSTGPALASLPDLIAKLEIEQETFSFLDGDREVTIRVSDVLAKLKALAEEVATVARIGFGERIDHENLMLGFRDAFGMMPCNRPSYWIGENDPLPQWNEDGLDDFQVLQVVERFFEQFESRLTVMANEAVATLEKEVDEHFPKVLVKSKTPLSGKQHWLDELAGGF